MPVMARATGWDLNDESDVFLMVFVVSKVGCGCSQLPPLSADCALTVKKNEAEIFSSSANLDRHYCH